MSKAVFITSGKGGTGKTACCAAIGSFLARSGHKTVLVDCDAALRNLDLALGLSAGGLWDFMDVIEGRAQLADALVPHPGIEGLNYLSAPAELPGPGFAGAFAELIGAMRNDFEFILLDSPAGIGSGFRMAAPACDMGIIVATGDLSSLRDGQRTAQDLRALGVPELRLLVNRLSRRAYRRIRRNVDEVIDTVGARLIGIISEDESVMEAGNRQIPLIDYGARWAWDQFSRVARRVAGENVPLGRF